MTAQLFTLSYFLRAHCLLFLSFRVNWILRCLLLFRVNWIFCYWGSSKIGFTILNWIQKGERSNVIAVCLRVTNMTLQLWMCWILKVKRYMLLWCAILIKKKLILETIFYILWNSEKFGETRNNAISIYLVWVSANQQCLPWGWNTRGTNWILRIQHFLSWFGGKRAQIQANP